MPRASSTERLTSAMIGCSLSRKRLNQPANSPSSSCLLYANRWVRSPSPLAMFFNISATPRIGLVTPRAVNQISSKPTIAARPPRKDSSRAPLALRWSRSACSSNAGANRVFFGTSSNTPHGAASGIGLKVLNMRSCPSCSTVCDLPPACKRTSAAP